MKKYNYDLEQRLIKFSVKIITVCKNVESSFAAHHLSKQLIRSVTSSALNYGEAQAAQSSKDFLHKMRICLKELRESHINLKIQKEAQLIKDKEIINELLDENNQLIAIFVTSIKTSKH